MRQLDATASPSRAVKPDVPSSAGKRAEKTSAETQESFEAAKGAVDATPKREDENPNVKSTSQRRVAANRRNCQKSTGPTERGKSHSRWNAVKHGILSKALLIIEGPGAEDVAAFYRWLDTAFALPGSRRAIVKRSWWRK